MPASAHARMPSAAYWEFELSPSAGPVRRGVTFTFRTTGGFWPAAGRLPVGTGKAP